jgi:hypothetical protein
MVPIEAHEVGVGLFYNLTPLLLPVPRLLKHRQEDAAIPRRVFSEYFPASFNPLQTRQVSDESWIPCYIK